MRITWFVLVSLLICGPAVAGPPSPDQLPMLRVGNVEIDDPIVDPRPPGPPLVLDADLDGFSVAIDCNDQDKSVSPSAAEIANGFDDDCDGVIDGGSDTTIDWPTVVLAKALWPTASGLGEDVSAQVPPRLAWTGDGFLAVWVDARQRLRMGRIGADGRLAAQPSTLRRPVSSLDVAWTGQQLGIAYQDDRIPGAPSVRLMLVDSSGALVGDLVLAPVGSEPKLAWGQDRFGVVWRVPGSTSVLRFQRFDLMGRPLSPEVVLKESTGRAAIAFDGTIVTPLADGSYRVHTGMFGVVYSTSGYRAESENLFVEAHPREDAGNPPVGPVRVNETAIPMGRAMPTIAANQSGFLLGWNTTEEKQDRAMVRYFTHDTLEASHELVPDADAGRYGRVMWTGGEFLMVNENRTSATDDMYEIHVRRLDADGNSHNTSPTGSWTELNLREHVPGTASLVPDLASAGDFLGMIWLEKNKTRQGTVAHLWFARIEHK